MKKTICKDCLQVIQTESSEHDTCTTCARIEEFENGNEVKWVEVIPLEDEERAVRIIPHSGIIIEQGPVVSMVKETTGELKCMYSAQLFPLAWPDLVPELLKEGTVCLT